MSAILQRLKYELKTEKRKVGTLAVLTLAGLLLWGKLLIPAGTERASGQEDIAVQSDGAGGSGEGAEREPIPEPPDPDVVRVQLRGRVRRDPFQIPRDRYEPTDPQPADDEPDPEAEQRKLRRAIQAEAEQLKLQSTLIGSQPQAIINGRPVAKGQTIRGFRLLEIRSREARLVKQGVEVTLRLRSD